MKILTIALAAASMAAIATTTTSVAALGGDRSATTRAGSAATSNRPKVKRTMHRRCRPIYSRVCYNGLPCKYVVTGYRCRLN